MARGWTTIALRNDLVARIDAFVDSNTEGFTSRGVLVAEVMRQFLEGRENPLTREELRKALLAVAATGPKTSAELLEALLAELDMRTVGEQRPARPQAGTSEARTKPSSSESTKRR